MRLIHIADLHASRERLQSALEVLGKVGEAAGDADMAVFAGDFFDSVMTNSESSGFPSLLAAVRSVADKCPVYMIYGTPSHEPMGCLDAFGLLGCRVFRRPEFLRTDKFELVLIPEPRLSGGFSAEDVREFVKKTAGEEKRAPRVCVFHGEVKGASRQNGMPVDGQSAIDKGLLESLGCDYYALGHIHRPQEVFKNAFYSGSAIPLNFGEEHDGHYNLVDISDGKVAVTEVPLEMPRFRTITYEDYLALPSKSMPGVSRLRVRMRGLEGERKKVEQYFKFNVTPRVQSMTGVPSVSLLFEPTDEAKARSVEIRSMRSLAEKVSEYAKVNGLSVPDGAAAILEEIQTSELAREPVPHRAFELLSVRIKGAKGIKAGCGKDELSVDFEKADGDILAVVGENGRGKTTLLENCSPYPFLLTRGGALREHFYLNPSVRETVWKDETGRLYKLVMNFYTGSKGAKSKYTAYTSDGGGGWRPALGVDGTLASFTRYVNSTFGPVDLYMRTAFHAKERSDRAPDIADATKGERIGLFSALAGIGQMRSVCAAARERAKAAEQEKKELSASIKALEDSSDADLIDVRIVKARRALRKAEDRLSEAEAERDRLLALDARFKASREERALKERMANDLKRRMAKNGIEAGNKAAELGKAQEYFNNIRDINIYRDAVTKADEARDAHSKAVGILNGRYSRNNEILSEMRGLDEPLNETERLIGSLNAKIAMLEDTEIEIGDRCPVCGAAIDEDKRSELLLHNFEARRGANELKKSLRAAKARRTKLEKSISRLRERQSALAAEISADEGRVKELAEYKKLAEMRMKSKEMFKPDREYTEAEKSALEAAVRELDEERRKMERELEAIEMPEEERDVSEELEAARIRLSEAGDEVSERRAEVKSLDSMKKDSERTARKIKELEARQEDAGKTAEACRFLEEAFGQGGIPALELENTAPDISRAANLILEGVLDGRFSVSIEPLRQGLERQIADFSVVVRDRDGKWERPLDMMSSGEKVWIRQALYGAFSVVLSEQTGLSFRTRFIDEADGSLFSGRRGEYVRLVKRIGELTGAKKTVLITQSQEVRDCVPDRIEL